LQDLEGLNSREFEAISRVNVSQKRSKNAIFTWSPAARWPAKGEERMINPARFLLAALCVGVVAGPASAADIEAPPPDAGYDWSGFYIGAHGGYGEADVSGEFRDSETNSNDPSPTDLKLNGIVGGAQAGFNWQINNFVLGAEGDVSVTDWSDSKAASGGSEKISADVDLLASLRARVGFAVDALLVYATAGAAWSDANYDVADTLGAPPLAGGIDFDNLGLVAGGGVEWGMSDHTSVRLEGLHYDFGDKKSAGDLVGDPSTFDDSVTLDDAWVVRLGVNWRF
jgi:outer membrane immunogenic protein